MKAKQLVITARAKQDLLSIGRYTTLKWGKNQRDVYLRSIDQTIQLLRQDPKIGKHRPEIKEGYYSIPSQEHAVFYIVQKNNIIVLAFLHKAMDIENYFGA